MLVLLDPILGTNVLVKKYKRECCPWKGQNHLDALVGKLLYMVVMAYPNSKKPCMVVFYGGFRSHVHVR